MPVNIFKNKDIKFIALFFIFLAVFSIAVFSLAILVDPYNLFGLNIFRPILLTNRSEKMRLLREAEIKPEAVILGSSRVFKMNPAKVEKLTGLKTFNASVSYARPEDHLALAKYLVNDLKIKPKLFLVGLHAGEFNNDKIDSQTINNPDLRKYLNISEKTRLLTVISAFKERFNAVYLRDIFVTIFWNSRGFPNPVITFDENGGEIFDYNIHPDPKAAVITENLAYGLFAGIFSLSSERKEYFEEFLKFAQENDIKINLMVLPLSPKITDAISETTGYKKMTEELLSLAVEWRNKFGIDVFDFSLVENFNGLEDDFDDSTHPSHINIDLMTEKMLKKFTL